ncbi:energy transducer TonB [Pseudoalteromonas luteoviolacea]|uniref:Protein TonB n=1 Tax=Pseudoalteromonas luteoviolacea S4054 TaxID=1129367 RepID=A0A0F6A7N3_9GAMM|nr:energy transducer TonB [Pseudoalteromonas luteoviolacea]AOT11142.1 hypothetical protein S4054249_25255 [Pseudoalteromonas luteoviolacea]AOT15694.1 hypothetical protein S40542_23255 [Pseudoalteromonas luteoviolacea]AOT20963.1 hypothetical protein S4054_25175 [Pseudoalteromonas luteoviolacea]KKE82247.1 hypothetical protein N479_19305 [Pseudoalteromonas luteoviolacea S4054]KZN65420.1 hypothetical protein N481_25025 [Pseudoalteromonas luteoviolacea S4047-1]
MKIITIGLIAALSTGCASQQGIDGTKEKPILDLTSSKKDVELYWYNTKHVAPVYPSSAAMKGISGCVEFEFVISSEGKATDIETIKSIPGTRFISAAKKALRQFKWQPAESNKFAQPVRTTAEIGFSTDLSKSVENCDRV